jgi:uncharacterized protein
MSESQTAAAGVATVDKPFVVDSDAHNAPFPADIAPYLPGRWREYFDTYGLRTPSELGLVRARFMASRTDSWPPSGKPPGSDPEFFCQELLDKWDIDRAILNSAAAITQGYLGGNQPPEFSAAIMTAANEWAADKWLARDERLYSAICTVFEEPELGARELRRWAAHPRFVQILLPFRTQRPLGHRRYWWLYEAAVEHDLPIVLHPGSTGNGLVTASGWPSYYFEDHVGFPQALIVQAASLIFEGVFDRFPDLKIVFAEGAWSWVVPYGWRLDRAWRQMRGEVRHIQRPPSEYLAKHFWFTSQPIEEPASAEQFVEAWQLFGREDRLLYSSDYPHWDFDSPEEALPTVLPEATRHKILGQNALDLYSRIAGPSQDR